jgi:hypothetical protein
MMSNTDPTKTSEGHKTQDEDKQTKEHNTPRESKMMSNTDPTQTSGEHKTQDEDKQTKEHNTPRESKMMSNTDPTKHQGDTRHRTRTNNPNSTTQHRKLK